MSTQHVPYFSIDKIEFLLAHYASTQSTNTFEHLQFASDDVRKEIDACLCDLGQIGRDIEIGYKLKENRKRYAELDAHISRLTDLRQHVRDVIDPPTEYIAFVEYKDAIWAQRRLTDGCKRPRANDRKISGAKRYDTTDMETFLKTLIKEGRMQPTYRVLPDDRNPIRVTLID